jgi:hypothetical protein
MAKDKPLMLDREGQRLEIWLYSRNDLRVRIKTIHEEVKKGIAMMET